MTPAAGGRCMALLLALAVGAASGQGLADQLRINGGVPAGPMDQVMINEGRNELFAVANAMKWPGLGYAPEWTTMDKGVPTPLPKAAQGAAPWGFGHKAHSFAQKHPNAVLAMQLGLAVKALEKISQSNFLEQRDNKLEGIEDGVENFLPPRPEFYVQVAGGDFIIGDAHGGECRKLYLAGTNKYELLEAGAGAPYLYDGKLEEPGLVGPEVVRRLMEDAKHQGLGFVRFSAFAVDADFSVLSPSGPPPGVAYNEAMLQGLDYVVDQARQHDLRVLLVLTDYFRDDAGGPLQYMKLSGTDLTGLTNEQIKARFYTNAAALGIYTNYVQAIINRVNTLNGRTYGSDPTVMGWDIMNEPRCQDAAVCDLTTIPTFVQTTYAFIKSLSVKQPVTVGVEGFYDIGPEAATYPTGLNPYGGQDSRADFNAACALVDFCEFNIYPDLWGQQNEGWVDAWVAGHSANGVALGKPVLVKEQGMQPTDQRVPFYSIMYASDFEQIVTDRKKSGGLKGAAYWQAWVPGTKAVPYTLAVGGRFGILPDAPAARYIRRFADEVDALSKHSAECPAGTSTDAVVLGQPKCKLGYEGVGCQDVNECVRGTDDCSRHAACVNTEGGFRCRCYEGFIGGGKVCAPQPLHLERIANAFYTKDTINCATSGTPVPYPKFAPGWVYDPTGRFTDSYDGNRVGVNLQECKTACWMSDQCTSFFWDAEQSKCLLRKDECPFITPNVPGCQAPGSGVPVPTICTDGQQYTPNSPAPPTPVPTFECGRAVTYFKRGAELPPGCGEAPPP